MSVKNRPASEAVVEIRPSPRWARVDFSAIWRWRTLLLMLVSRDIKLRYRQTVLGPIWIVLQPLMTVAVFTFVIGYVAQVSTGGIPYPIYVMAALTPWTIFARALGEGANSIVGQESLVTKVYLPRHLLPVASAISGLLDSVLVLAVLMGVLLYAGFEPRLATLLVVPAMLYAAFFGYACALWASALCVLYRDVRTIMPTLLQVGLFVTPILYPRNAVPASIRMLYDLNPMIAPIELMRWACFGGPVPEVGALIYALAAALAVAFGGAFFFRSCERQFVDRI